MRGPYRPTFSTSVKASPTGVSCHLTSGCECATARKVMEIGPGDIRPSIPFPLLFSSIRFVRWPHWCREGKGRKRKEKKSRNHFHDALCWDGMEGRKADEWGREEGCLLRKRSLPPRACNPFSLRPFAYSSANCGASQIGPFLLLLLLLWGVGPSLGRPPSLTLASFRTGIHSILPPWRTKKEEGGR